MRKEIRIGIVAVIIAPIIATLIVFVGVHIPILFEGAGSEDSWVQYWGGLLGGIIGAVITASVSYYILLKQSRE